MSIEIRRICNGYLVTIPPNAPDVPIFGNLTAGGYAELIKKGTGRNEIEELQSQDSGDDDMRSIPADIYTHYFPKLSGVLSFIAFTFPD